MAQQKDNNYTNVEQHLFADCYKQNILDENILLLIQNLNEDNNKESQLGLYNIIEQQIHLESDNMVGKLKSILLESLNQYKAQNSTKAVLHLDNLFKYINSLNFQNVSLLIKQSENASKEIFEKEIVMVLGFSGAGKSTFIHYLAGSKITKIFTDEGLPHWETSEPKYPALERVVSKADAKSETKCVIPISINTLDQEGNEFGAEDNYIICDTPGTNDSDGIESEIANLTGIINCIQAARSIKFIFLISEKQIGDRGQGIKSIAKMIRSMVRPSQNFNQVIDKFLFVYSKFDSQELKATLPSKLQNIFRCLNYEEKKDQEFTYVLRQMISQTMQQDRIVFFDLQIPGYKFLEDNIKQRFPINMPKEVFTSFLTSEAYMKISLQLNSDIKRILIALEKNNFLLVQKKLEQLNALKDNIQGLEILKQQWQQNVDIVGTFISRQLESVDKFITSVMTLKSIEEGYVKEFLSFKNSLNNIKILSDFFPQSKNLLNSLEQSIPRVIQKIMQLVEEESMTFQKNDLNSLYQKIIVFSTVLNTKEYVESFVKIAMKKILNKINETYSLIKQENILGFFNEIQQIFNFIEDCPFFSQNIIEIKDQIDKALEQPLNLMEEQKQLMLKQINNFNQKDIEQTKKNLSNYQQNFQNFAREFQKSKLLNQEYSEKINNLQKELRDQIYILYSQQEEIIKDALRENSTQIKNMKQKILKLSIISKIFSGLENNFSNLMNHINKSIQRVIEKVKQIVQDLSSAKKDQELEIQFLKLDEIFQTFTDCSWVQEFDEDQEYETFREDIFRALRKFANMIIGRFEQIEISFQEMEEFDKIADCNEKIKKLKQYQNQDKQLQQIICDYEKETKLRFNIYFESIKQMIQTEDIDYFQTEKGLNFLEKCSKNKIFKSIAQDLLEKLKVFIKTKCKTKEQKIANQFQMLKLVLDQQQLQLEDRQKIIFYSQTIHECFIEMQQIDKYPTIKSILELSKIQFQLEIQQSYLRKLYQNIKQNIDEQSHVAQKWIFIIQQLKHFDDFDIKTYSFVSLLEECHLKNKTNIIELKKGFEKHTSNQSLMHMQKTLLQLKEAGGENNENKEQQQTFQELKTEIEFEMKQMATSIQQNTQNLKQMATYFPIQKECNTQIQNSNDLIKKCQQLDQYINTFKDLIDVTSINSQLLVSNQNIKTLAQSGPKNVKQAFKNTNYQTSNDQYQYLEELFKILKQYFNIDEEFEVLSNCRNDCFLELQQKFENFQIDSTYGVRLNLCQITNKLDLVGDELHTNFSKNLQEIYKQKLIEKLDSVKEKPFKTQEDTIKVVQNFFSNIPQDMKDYLSNYIKEIKNIDKINRDFEQYQKTKNYSKLRYLQELIAHSEVSEQFNSQLDEFFTREIEQASKQIISSVKQNDHTHLVQNLINLIKIAVEGPSDFNNTSNQKLQEIFELFIEQFKKADSAVSQIIMREEQVTQGQQFDLKQYNSLAQNLQNFKSKLINKEKEFVQNLPCFLIFQKMEELNSQAIDKIRQKVKQIKNLSEDFSNLRRDFYVVYYLRFFDINEYQKLIDHLDQQYSKLSQIMKEIINKDQIELIIEKDFESYYESFSQGMRHIKIITAIQNDVSNQTNKNKIFEDLINKQNAIIITMNSALKDELEQDIMQTTVANNINKIYLNAKYLNQYFSANQLKNALNSNQIQHQMLEKLRSQFPNPYNLSESPSIQTLAKYISSLQQITSQYIYMEQVKKECEENISQTITSFQNRKGSLEKLQIILKTEKHGHQIIKNYPVFKGFQISETNQRVQQFTLNNVMEQVIGYYGNASNNDLDKNQLNEYYNKFESTYNKYLDEPLYLNLYEKIDFISLQKQILESAKHINFQESGQLQQTSLAFVPDLLAGIFACWTCINSKYYFESQAHSFNNSKSFLIKPHSAQIIAIFRLLGIGYSTDYKNVQPNSLAQVLTGQGKSVILAVLACFYSICGFQVKCACYSNELSTRDFREFQDLFQKLQILDKIKYGTFNQVCEMVLNQQGDIRQLVSNFIENEKIETKINPQNQTKQIFLIDEVDFFFNKDFQGNNYEIIASLSDPTIENLFDLIWKSKDASNFGYQLISQSSEFQDCITKYSKWSELIQEQTKIMIYDFKNFKNQIKESYKILNDKIYYKNQDQYLDNISYGYRTLFSYYQEHQDYKISSESLRKQKTFKINSGSFSYSQLPNQFWIIKGVTGTLETLSKGQLELIQNSYKISQFTLIPSVYGSSKFQFNKQKDVKVVSKEEYFNFITDEINQRMMGRTDQNRAVLVFFVNKEALLEYYLSKQFKALQPKAQIMTEDNSIEERKKIIKDATHSGVITLLTRIFGRGIDFQVSDTIILQNYGIHVIQTFFSDDISEETQTKGRTARKGEEGSYSMVLNIDSLQAFLKTDEDTKKVENSDEAYAVLSRNREINFESDFKSNLEYDQKTSLVLHQQSETFLKLMIERNLSEVKKYLLKLNQGPRDSIPSKTLIAMDATGSMSQLITQTKNAVQTTFEQSREILKDKGYDPDCFLVMFCIFRSYSSKWEEIFESSQWENNPEKLRQFIQKITAKGGTGPGESVEVGLWWANQKNNEDPISQVIILGDQPAHLQSEAQMHRKQYGQAYWDKTPLKGVDYYIPECEKLKSKDIPVHAFYLDDKAKTTYEQISKLTNGESGYLDITQKEGSKKLTTIFVEQILKNIGKQDGRSNELIKAYRAKYS